MQQATSRQHRVWQNIPKADDGDYKVANVLCNPLEE